VPSDGIAQVVGNLSQLGLLVVAVVAAQALALDARPGLAVFVRSRQPRPAAWVLPRWAGTTVACLAAWTLALAGAWYETALLLGPLPAGAVLLGWLLWCLYLAFAVAVAALAAGLVRSTVAVAALTVGLLLALGVVGLVPQLGEWLPGALVGSPTALADGQRQAGDYVRPAAVTVAATVAALLGAVSLLRRREV
jgi:ABC-2 type transport system permease protein